METVDVRGLAAEILAAAWRLPAGLEEALSSRSTVDMAKGVLTAQLAIDADAAFDLPRQRSRRHHIKPRDLAGHVVAEAARPHPRPEPSG